jgi:hypothetical protein
VIPGTQKYTDEEKSILLSYTEDYMLFGLKDSETLQRLSKKLGRPISSRTLYYLKREVKAKRVTSDQWLDKFARVELADFYRQRLEELQYLQSNLFLILDEEKAKGIDKMNAYKYNQIAKTVIENSKVLAEYGLSIPIISKIKELLPVDINELNERLKRNTKELTHNAIDIEGDEYITTRTSENEQVSESELDRIRELQKDIKSSIRVHFGDKDSRRTSESDKSDESEDENRVF